MMIVTHPLMLYIDLTGSGTWTAGLLPCLVHNPVGTRRGKGPGSVRS